MDELLRWAVLDISGLCWNLRKHLDKDVKELYKAAKE
jgi:hypothetical protein